ncbi:ADP-ribosylation factor GTPase-activating protein 3 isoform X1 [Anopheles gambiae]|uniref:ADP-ribosylation factor GTPase-activating protein 3 isoform X1 n=1 Tax=Anopheles gambiae TaxID=7165 RepID=UPI002AC91EB4|nr:ADP-ribosylation factor GTPase-activating protein 3 isoform X1 [Anopheles gambiae]
MAGGSSPSKEDIDAIFHRLRSQATNKTCFDCGAKNPTWSTVTYGVFICIDCSAVHRNLGVHLTFVRSTNLDTNWTWLQIRQMQVGGNANAAQFFRQHNCNTTDAQQKYNSRAAQLYKDKLLNKAQQSLQLYGTTLHIDNAHDLNTTASEKKEMDFFADCDNFDNDTATVERNNNPSSGPKVDAELENIPKLASLSATVDPTAGPRVDFLTSEVPVEPVKSTIGVRKIQPKKGGLGAKKGGLGATRVKTNFAEIEERANMADKLKLAPAPEKPITEEEKAETLASVRLAYQDLSIKQHREEEKLKAIDPNKAKQIERLGMGFGRAAGVSHSALTDMKTLTPEEATRSSAASLSKALYDRDDSSSGGGGGGSGGGGGGSGSGGGGSGGNDFFDDYSIIYGFSGSGKGADMSEATQMGFDTLEPIDSKRPTVKTMFSPAGGSLKGGSSSISDQPTYSRGGGSSSGSNYNNNNNNSSSSSSNNSSSRRNGQPQPVDSSDVAQKKFGSAKGISSDQFFGDEQSSYERSANLSKFQGSTSISSADYFGHGSSSMGSGGSRSGGGGGGPRGPALQYNGPDLEDVRESVRQGVTKVAGRLSSLASDVMNSIQDKYGY